MIWYCTDVFMRGGLGVARKSAITFAIIDVAAVCEVALRFVCTPTGTKPKTAIRQNPATPKASVTSTSENAAVLQFQGLMVGKRELRHLWEQFVLLPGFPRPDCLVASG